MKGYETISNNYAPVILPSVLKKNGFSLNEHIFRYRLDDTKGKGNTINEILRNEIWHSSVALLNDPFELFFKSNKNEMNEITDDDLFFLWSKYNEVGGDNFDAKIYFHLNKDKIKINMEKAMEIPIDELIDGVRKMVCFACFTQVCDSRLMWGYYCNGLSGVCLIYNKNKLSRNGVILKEVNYSEQRPIINLCQHVIEYNRDGNVRFMEPIIFSKHQEWVHEHEYRAINYLANNNELEMKGKLKYINENCLDGIIIGERCTPETIEIISEHASKHGIKMFSAKANLERYIVEILKI